MKVNVILHFRFYIVILAAYTFTGCCLKKTTSEMDFGHFVGIVKVEWPAGEERKMKLIEDFSYIDPKGKEWTAKKGYETDGATIPPVFWPIIGGPFEDNYREAAVIHDWYCYKKTEPWRDVHRILYYASRAGGVSEIKAKIIYAAVRIGGPKWGGDSSKCYSNCHAVVEGYSKDKTGRLVYIPKLTSEDAKTISEWVKTENPSLEDIERFAQDKYPKSKFGH